MIRISGRDRKVLIIGGAVVLLFLILQFGLFPLMDNRDRTRKGLAAREKAMVEMRELQVRYRELHGKANALMEQLGGREAGFSLFAFLEQMAAQSEVKKNIAYMKPSESAGDEGPFKEVLVEIKLQDVSLKQLVDFLQLIEAPDKIVALKRISIQEGKKETGTLDVIMQVVSLDRKAGEPEGP
ncbi:MAG: type II secretion system protein GspM [Desulfobulbaceae bacterium]|jgi:general secretion pathway protein M